MCSIDNNLANATHPTQPGDHALRCQLSLWKMIIKIVWAWIAPIGVFSKIQRKLLDLVNSIACLAVHYETDTGREFPQRACKDHPSFLKPTGNCFRSRTLPQEPQLSWDLERPGFHFLDHSQNKVSATKKIIAQPLATCLPLLVHGLLTGTEHLLPARYYVREREPDPKRE